ncbi:hypothetical protein [Promicromonospora sp. NPDC090134]|uniref:hypothetical protein n=1 Tax=Promicromonospora sp. NPDC090134 TaxID=3364408 RepID=UPI0037F154F7
MTDDVLYTTSWNDLTRRPVLGHDWLDEEQARAQFEKRDLDIVDAAERDDEGTPRPRWVIGIGQTGARVQFFDQHTTMWHMVDWRETDGRLWRWITYDYIYTSQDRNWSQRESILTHKSSVETDGTGYVVTVDKSTRPGQRLKTDFIARASEAYWLNYPEFGNWSDLSEPGPSAYQVAGRETPMRAS